MVPEKKKWKMEKSGLVLASSLIFGKGEQWVSCAWTSVRLWTVSHGEDVEVVGCRADSDVHWKLAEQLGQSISNPPTPLATSFLW